MVPYEYMLQWSRTRYPVGTANELSSRLNILDPERGFAWFIVSCCNIVMADFDRSKMSFAHKDSKGGMRQTHCNWITKYALVSLHVDPTKAPDGVLMASRLDQSNNSRL